MSPGSSAALVTPPAFYARPTLLHRLSSALSRRSRCSTQSADSMDDKDALLIGVDDPGERKAPIRRPAPPRRRPSRRRALDAAEGNEWNVPCVGASGSPLTSPGACCSGHRSPWRFARISAAGGAERTTTSRTGEARASEPTSDTARRVGRALLRTRQGSVVALRWARAARSASLSSVVCRLLYLLASAAPGLCTDGAMASDAATPARRPSARRRLSSAFAQQRRTGVPLVRCDCTHCHQRCPSTCRQALAVDAAAAAPPATANHVEHATPKTRTRTTAAMSVAVSVALAALAAVELLLCFPPSRSTRTH